MKNLLKKFIAPYFIFGSFSRPIIPFYVNLMYYNLKKGTDKEYNVGDLLSKVIFDFLLEYFNIKTKKSKYTIRFSFIGSVLQFLSGNAVIYGSGFIRDDKMIVKRFKEKKLKLDIRAVRGPLTKQLLENMGYKTPDVFGDPAVLLPLFYKPKTAQKKDEYLVIPHWKQVKKYKELGYPVLSPLTNDWKTFIDKLTSTRLVISSSLHGIILAESYGIPAIFLNDIDKSDLFKYDDYYFSTNRYDYRKAKDINEALIQYNTIQYNTIITMQKNLLKNFPIDIFKK